MVVWIMYEEEIKISTIYKEYGAHLKLWAVYTAIKFCSLRLNTDLYLVPN